MLTMHKHFSIIGSFISREEKRFCFITLMPSHNSERVKITGQNDEVAVDRVKRGVFIREGDHEVRTDPRRILLVGLKNDVQISRWAPDYGIFEVGGVGNAKDTWPVLDVF